MDMAQSSVIFARRTSSIAARIAPDRRRHKRVAITINGRFMRANKLEYSCRLIDISVGGAALQAPVAVDIGERIVAYLDHLGGLEGSVARVFDNGFAIRFSATQRKREKLAAQLTFLINRNELQQSEERRHERVIPDSDEATLQLAEGIIIGVKVLDVSISGASIATQARPPIGLEVMIGKLRAKVARHHSAGIGLQFLDTQEITSISQHFK